MDNIQDKIAEIMSDPEALSQVQNLGKMLGIGGGSQESTPVPSPSPVQSHNNDLLSGETFGKITKLMPLISQIHQEDDTTRLLGALRPFLSEEKCRKLDSAKKMIQFMKIIPLLKEGGLMDLGLF